MKEIINKSMRVKNMNKINNFGIWSLEHKDYLYVEVDPENKILKIRGEDQTGHKAKIKIIKKTCQECFRSGVEELKNQEKTALL